MNDLFNNKAKCWNQRLKVLMDEKGYKQERFADALNKRYGTQFGQKTVSRWQHIGDKANGTTIVFPKYETMLKIAEFLGVDVGYLTGETDYKTYSIADACAFLGLNSEAVCALREITQRETKSPYMENTRNSLARLLSAKGFSAVIDCVDDAYSSSQSIKDKFASVINFDDDLREMEYVGRVERYELNEALMQLVNELFSKPT